jgi:hypothetical protein
VRRRIAIGPSSGTGVSLRETRATAPLRMAGRSRTLVTESGKPAGEAESGTGTEPKGPGDNAWRAESAAILQGRVSELGISDADRLAAGLGDLPLAIAQAAGFMAETGMPADQYLGLLATQAGKLLDQAAAGASYPLSLAAVTRLAAGRLDREDPAAALVASMCAFLAPEPVPGDLFTNSPGVLPGELAARAADPLAWRQVLARLAQQSLARVDQRGLVMHRLTQAILRDRLTAEQAAATRAGTEAMLAAADPGFPRDPVSWPRWAQLVPHLLAADTWPPPPTRTCARQRVTRADT